MKGIKEILFLLILTFLTGCVIFRYTEMPNDRIDASNYDSDDMILFLNFEMFKGSKIDSIALINTQKTQGFLKMEILPVENIEEGQLKISFFDEQMNQVKNTAIEDPLIKIAEYTIDNENKVLQSQILKLEKAEFTFRTRWDDKIKYVRVEKMLENQRLVLLNQFELFNP
ncbi:MAG: hypothetical protein EHM93_16430 [Bacteroidales bacterium]|nr:MAG: hypothetical protein EHM93_16430 [Bacteroidales bacterium]